MMQSKRKRHGMNFLEFKVQGTKYVKKYYLNYISMLKSWLTILTRKDLKKKKINRYENLEKWNFGGIWLLLTQSIKVS